MPSATPLLRIALVTETYPPEVNGVAMTIARLANGLHHLGHEVQLIRPRQKSVNDVSADGVTDLVTVPGFTLPFYRSLQLGLPASGRLHRLWCDTPPDVVHIVTEGPLGASALRVARRLELLTVSGFHTNFHTYSSYYRLGFLQRLIIAYLRHFHNRCQATLVPTLDTAHTLQNLAFDNIHVLARGVDTQLFSPARRSKALRRDWQADDNTPIVLYVGRIAAEKNLSLAITAFQAIANIRPDARFVLVGDGPMAAKLRNDHPEFIFCGTRRGIDLAAHYASADIFLFPSLTETFGNVTLEAMASGLAVIAFDYAAAREHIEHGLSGLLAPLDDAAAFVTAAQNAVQNVDKTRLMGNRAMQVVQTFDWNRIVDELVRHYLNLNNKTIANRYGLNNGSA